MASDLIIPETRLVDSLQSECRTIVEINSPELVKDIRDRAEAIRQYMRQQKSSHVAQNAAAELKIRAERRLGELLADTVRRGGDRKSNYHRGSLIGKLPEGVSYNQSSRYQQIASVPAETFEEHVEKTKTSSRELTSAGVLRLAKIQKAKSTDECTPQSPPCTVADLYALIDSGKTFGTIYADPPWQYSNQGTRAATDNHYQTLTVQELCQLPISNLAASPGHLHLWTTNGFLQESFQVLESWGFEYKSLFVWVKPQMGIGNYWRVSHELLLLGVRGNAPFVDKSHKSWLQADRTRHSEKPKEIRQLIEKVSPGPKLELFGRHPVDGWIVWGDQIEKTMFDDDVKEIA